MRHRLQSRVLATQYHFTCRQSQHGGQETTITSFHSTLLHHARIVRDLVSGPAREAR